jgi:hypothetical protein
MRWRGGGCQVFEIVPACGAAMLRPYWVVDVVGIWVGLSLNPHPLKPEGAAPTERRAVDGGDN